MSTQFSLADLIPEPLTFKDDAFGGEGVIFDVLTSELLSSQDIATLRRIRNRLIGEPQEEETADLIININLLVSLLIPDMPSERIHRLPLGAKEKFFAWWLQSTKKKKRTPSQ
jgi:hypothetical protein